MDISSTGFTRFTRLRKKIKQGICMDGYIFDRIYKIHKIKGENQTRNLRPIFHFVNLVNPVERPAQRPSGNGRTVTTVNESSQPSQYRCHSHPSERRGAVDHPEKRPDPDRF